MSKASGKSTHKKMLMSIATGERVAAYLRDQHPDNTAKRLAQVLPEVSPRTIEGWLQGKRPNGTHMDMLVSLFGLGFVRSVWGAVIKEPLDNFEAMEKLNDVQRDIEELRRALVEKDRNETQGRLPFENW